MSGVAARPSFRYYHWWVSGKPISVQLASTVISGLAVLKQESAGHGGLLLGRMVYRKRGAECEVIVDGYEPLPCTFRRLSEELFSEPDRVVWEQALARQLKPGADGLAVVGYYRNHRDPDLWLSAWDLALIRRYFPKREDIVLLIHSEPDSPPYGGFFFKEGQEPRSGSTYLRFPLNAQKLVLETPLSLAAPPVDIPQPATPELRIKRKRSYRWTLVPISALALSAAFYLGYKMQRPVPPSVAESSPELRIQSEPTGLRVIWNQNSKAVQQAERGVFEVIDGTHKEEITLDAKEIAFGSLAYTPRNSDVKFTLTLNGRSGELLRASVRALVPPSKTVAKPLALQTLLDAAAKPVTIPRKFEGLTRSAPAPKPELIVEPPPLVSRSAPTPAIQPRLEPLPPPPEPVKEPQAAKAPVPASATTKVEPPRPVPVAVTTPAIAIRRVLPARPAQLQILLSHLSPEEANVGVKVYIDAQGKVTRAEPLPQRKGTSASNYLGRLAADAASMWRFQPATIDKRPVPSENVVYFNFRSR